jgi:broad specificity phosphatase PhoE
MIPGGSFKTLMELLTCPTLRVQEVRELLKALDLMNIGDYQPFLYHKRMKLYLARHTQTNYNARGLCNADPSVDVHLTPTGIAQAGALADELKDVPIQHIFVSELKRTLQTAEIINRYPGVNIEAHPLLNDIRSQFEGRPFQEYVKALDAAADRWTVRFNGGESIEDIKKRADDFISYLRAKDYDSTLVVTSEWIIRAMIMSVENISYEDAWALKMTQGSFIELEI